MLSGSIDYSLSSDGLVLASEIMPLGNMHIWGNQT